VGVPEFRGCSIGGEKREKEEEEMGRPHGGHVHCDLGRGEREGERKGGGRAGRAVSALLPPRRGPPPFIRKKKKRGKGGERRGEGGKAEGRI